MRTSAVIGQLLGLLDGILGALQPLVALGTRWWVSWQFLKSGVLKLTDWDMTLALFRDEYHTPVLSPGQAAVVGTFGELFFPVLLIMGLFGRVAAVGLFAVNALTFASFGIILVADLPLVDHFNGGAVGYMLLTTLWGIGAVVGSTSATRLTVHREYHALVIGTAAMAISIGSIAFMPNLFGAIAVGTLGGIGSGLAFTPWFSLLQRATADSQRGTAFAMADTFEQSSFIAGMIVAGWAVGFLGPQTVYLLPAALLLVAMTIALRQGSAKPATVMVKSPSAGSSAKMNVSP